LNPQKESNLLTKLKNNLVEPLSQRSKISQRSDPRKKELLVTQSQLFRPKRKYKKTARLNIQIRLPLMKQARPEKEKP